MARDDRMLAERRLVSAVLVDALEVITMPVVRPGQRRLYEETWCWLLADDPSWPFSFRNVCEVLGLDPDRVRDRVIPRQAAGDREKPRARVIDIGLYRMRAAG